MGLPTQSSECVVLVVDDEPAVRGLASRMLREAGFTVVEAGDGHAAWMLFQRQPGRFSVLLADVVMPRVPGTELAARVHLVRPELPVLLMSGYTPSELLARGLETEHGALVTKPFDPERLLAAVRKVLGTTGEPSAPAHRR